MLTSLHSLAAVGLSAAGLLVLLAASCGGESKAGERDALDHFREARLAAHDALTHLRDGLHESLDDAREHWHENRDQWKRDLDAQLERMRVELDKVRGKGKELMPLLRDQAESAADELRQVRNELTELLDRAEQMAEDEWATKAEALRRRMVELERKLDGMHPK